MNEKETYNLLVDFLKFINKRNIDNNIRFSPEQKEFLKMGIDLYCEEIKRKNGLN